MPCIGCCAIGSTVYRVEMQFIRYNGEIHTDRGIRPEGGKTGVLFVSLSGLVLIRSGAAHESDSDSPNTRRPLARVALEFRFRYPASSTRFAHPFFSLDMIAHASHIWHTLITWPLFCSSPQASTRSYPVGLSRFSGACAHLFVV